jgi:hypothetical protein
MESSITTTSYEENNTSMMEISWSYISKSLRISLKILLLQVISTSIMERRTLEKFKLLFLTKQYLKEDQRQVLKTKVFFVSHILSIIKV